jgi:hypothetical protein
MALLSGSGNEIYRRAKKWGRYLKFLLADCGGEKSRESAPSEIEKLGELERERCCEAKDDRDGEWTKREHGGRGPRADERNDTDGANERR